MFRIKDHLLSEHVLSLMPILIVGWSDSVLSPSEIVQIQKKIEALPYLTAEDRAYLNHFTDPTNVPDEKEFEDWHRVLNTYSKKLSISEKWTLARLGIEMAKVGTRETNGIFNDPETIEAIQGIEKAMGLDGEKSQALMMHQLHLDKEVEEKHSWFKTEKMRAILHGNKDDVIQRITTLLQDPIFEYSDNPNKDNQRKKTLNQLKMLAQQGLGKYAFPSLSGSTERSIDHIAIFEALAYGDLSLMVKFGVQFGLFGGAIYGLGTSRHHLQYLEKMADAELLGCFAMTETGHGSNVRGLETTITYNHKNSTLIIHSPTRSSGKEYIGNALHASHGVVFGQLIIKDKNYGVHAVVVPLRNEEGKTLPGIQIEDCGYKMGLNGVDNGRIWFNQVQVPVDQLLNKYGGIDNNGEYQSSIKNDDKRFFTMLGALVAGRICIGLASVNVSKSALSIAIEYAEKRRQFKAERSDLETKIINYPIHQRRLFPKLAKTYGYYLALTELAYDYIKGDPKDQREIETRAAGLKAMASWHCTETVQKCREACGGKGYLSENRIPALKADADIFTTFEGDNVVLLQLVSKGLLTSYKQSFHDEGFYAVIKYLGERISHTVLEFNPIYKRNASSEHLLDRSFHLHAFKYREKKLLISLGNRIQSFLKRKISLHDTFLKTQNHMISLSKGAVESSVLQAWVKKIDTLEEGPEKDALNKMCDLFALSVLEEQKGWFLEADYMDGNKTKAIRRMVTKLCQDIRPYALDYVHAFGIPKSLLDAEIID